MERLFLIIGRINSILFLLVLLGAASLIAWTTLESNRWERRGAVEVNESESGAKKRMTLSFERAERIVGTNTLMVRLTAQEKSTKFSSGGYGNETRNIFFLNDADTVVHWLFNDHQHLILNAMQLHENSPGAEKLPTRALFLEYVAEDTNKDKKLSIEDNLSVGLAKPNGQGLTEILKDVNRVLSYNMVNPGHLSLVYQKGKTVRHAKISIAAMKVDSDQEIVNVSDSI